MKNAIRILAVAALAAVASLSPAARAASGGPTVVFHAPFAFDYGSKHLPAGQYIVTSQNSDFFRIRGNGNVVGAMGYTDNTSRILLTGKVTFVRVGNRYFLRDICVPNSAERLHLYPSRAQKRAAAELTVSGKAPQEVTIATGNETEN